jgi:hypothetical protein
MLLCALHARQEDGGVQVSATLLDMLACLCLLSVLCGVLAVVATLVFKMPWVLAIPMGLFIAFWAIERVTRI